MSHHCGSALVTCEDFRLHQRKDGRNYVAEFIKKTAGDCDLITRGGGIQDIVRPKIDGHCSSLLKDINVSARIHSADKIYFINHEDCGAYSSMNFSSREKELEQHHQDLEQAQKIILEKFPEKEVLLYFAELQKGTADVFLIKRVKKIAF